MKRLLFLTLAVIAALGVAAQETPDNDDSQYSHQYNKLYKNYVKEPENVASMLALAEFYADTANPMRNYATAMKYITSAEDRFVVILEDRDKYREVSRLLKHKINLQLLRQTKYSIILKARHFLDTEETINENTLDSYADAFRNDQSTMRLIDYRRMESRYLKACKENTLESYKQFIDSYAATSEGEDAVKAIGIVADKTVAAAQTEKEVDSLLADYFDIESVKSAAQRRKSAIAYAALCANPSQRAYRDFISKYPGSNEYSLVLEKMDNEVSDQFSRLSTPREYADFALNNPDNPLAEQAIEKLKRSITEQRNMEALHIYLDEFPLDVNHSDIYLTYYNWHTEEGNLAPLQLFSDNNPDFPFKAALDNAIDAALHYDSIDISMPFVEKDFSQWASKIYHLTGKRQSFVALQRTLQHLIAAKNWHKALERIDYFALSFEDNCVDQVAELRSILERPENHKLTLTPIVRPSYSMMHPLMHPDGQRLFYNRSDASGTAIHSAQWTPTKNSGIWKGAGKIAFTNITNENIHIFNFFDNGNKMLLGKDGDIMVAEQGSDGWTVIETLPEPVNGPYNDFDAYMLPDGNGILFASDRPGGQNLQPSYSYFHGDTKPASDIYFCPRSSKGWGQPVNLGIGVNSPYMECSPVVSDDLKTIYFITDGRGGMGYCDLYFATRDNVDDWQHWSSPTNYGKEINSGGDESSVTPGADRKMLTICSNSHGRYGAYTIPAMHTIDDRMRTVSINANEVGFSIDIVDAETQKVISKEQRIPRQSQWQTSLFADKQYLLFIHCDGLFIPAQLFTPSASDQLTPHAYEKSELNNMSRNGKPLPLPGIIFENNKDQLKASSLTEVDHLAQFLTSHQYLNIEIIINVAGSNDTFCYNLSQARGQQLKQQLANRGIDADRIVVSPYGNSIAKKDSSAAPVSVNISY